MAGTTEADIIVFCGVHFMAETASIISPNKKVLIPAEGAGCSLAEGVAGYDLKNGKKQTRMVSLSASRNTTADREAYTDYCCTSSNALKIVQACRKTKNSFVPTRFGCPYIQKSPEGNEFGMETVAYMTKIDTQMVLDKWKNIPM